MKRNQTHGHPFNYTQLLIKCPKHENDQTSTQLVVSPLHFLLSGNVSLSFGRINAELSWVYFGENWEFQTRERNHRNCKSARTSKQTESYRVVAPWLVAKVYSIPRLHRSRMRGKKLPDDQRQITAVLVPALVSRQLRGYGRHVCSNNKPQKMPLSFFLALRLILIRPRTHPIPAGYITQRTEEHLKPLTQITSVQRALWLNSLLLLLRLILVTA